MGGCFSLKLILGTPFCLGIWFHNSRHSDHLPPDLKCSSYGNILPFFCESSDIFLPFPIQFVQGTGLLASVHSYNSWCGFGLAFRSQRTSNEGSSFSNSAHLDANCLGSIRFVPLWISNGHSFTYCLLRVITPWTSQPRRSPWNRCAAKDVAKKAVDDDQGWWGWGYQVIPESYIVMLDSMPYSLIIVLYVFIFSNIFNFDIYVSYFIDIFAN